MSQASSVELQMLALINAERASYGLAPLRINNRLNASAEAHSKWMLEADVFSHTGAAGSTADQRMRAAGYRFEGNWANGENIAFQSLRGAAGISDDVVDLHRSLMNSPGHRANILNPGFTEIGIGVESGEFFTSGRNWPAAIVTQNFGTSSADNSGTTPAPVPVIPPRPAITEGADVIQGTAAADRIDARAGNDRISGLGGNDSLTGGLGNDSLEGGDGNDSLDGGIGDDLLSGDLGHDWIGGGLGADRLDGGAGNDTLYGGDGNDRLFGGEGTDSLDGGLGDDNLAGGAGHDRILAGAGADVLAGDLGDDQLDGGDGADALAGGFGNDRLWGGAGNDLLNGDAGNDMLSGGLGNDRLLGGLGQDQMTGGAGEDVFVFNRAGGQDQVMDFADNLDTLGFDRLLWGTARSAQEFVATKAVFREGSAIFDFGNGDVLTVTGLRSLSQLYDDVMLVV